MLRGTFEIRGRSAIYFIDSAYKDGTLICKCVSNEAAYLVAYSLNAMDKVCELASQFEMNCTGGKSLPDLRL